MQSKSESSELLEQKLSAIKNISALSQIRSEFPDKDEEIVQFMLNKKNFMSLVNNSRDLKLTLSFFPEYREELFDLISQQDVFEHVIPTMNDFLLLSHLFPENKEKLLPIVLRYNNIKRIITSDTGVTCLYRVFSNIKMGCNLHLMSELPKNTAPLKRSYVFFNDRLIYINLKGETNPVPIRDLNQFKENLAKLNQDESNVLTLNAEEIKQLITSNGDHAPKNPFFDFNSYTELLKSVERDEPDAREQRNQNKLRAKTHQTFFIQQGAFTKELELRRTDYSLSDYLKKPNPLANEMIITIGSAVILDKINNDATWEQNIVFDSNNRQLILNIDPHFNKNLDGGAEDTELKKYLNQSFDIYIAREISPLITDLLRKNITVVICDLRSPSLKPDVIQIIKDNLAYYKGPNDDHGNLILLEGYFGCYPLFWPKKSYVEAASQSKETASAYYNAMNTLRCRAGGSEENLVNAFKDNPIVPIDSYLDGEQDAGILFSYPEVGEISKAAAHEHPHNFRQ